MNNFQSFPTFRRWFTCFASLITRCGLTSRAARWAYLSVFVILIAPIAIGALLPPRFGYFSFPEDTCLCGHRQYYLIRGDRMVAATFGHESFRELFELKVGKDGHFDLYGASGELEGDLLISRPELKISIEDEEYRVPRAWNLWRVWYDRISGNDLWTYETLEVRREQYREHQAHQEQNKSL